jgi:hypothetical protein
MEGWIGGVSGWVVFLIDSCAWESVSWNVWARGGSQMEGQKTDIAILGLVPIPVPFQGTRVMES